MNDSNRALLVRVAQMNSTFQGVEDGESFLTVSSKKGYSPTLVIRATLFFDRHNWMGGLGALLR